MGTFSLKSQMDYISQAQSNIYLLKLKTTAQVIATSTWPSKMFMGKCRPLLLTYYEGPHSNPGGPYGKQNHL